MCFDRCAIGEQLDHENGKRVDVGLSPDRAERIVELLGRGVGRREHADLSDGRGARAERERVIGDDFGHAEVQNFELRAPVRVGDEDVRRVEVAVHDPLRMGEGHRVGDRIE